MESQERLESEQRYRAIFEATSDGLVVNTLDGTVVEVNPAFCRMHGFTRDELIGQHLTLFLHPDSHPLLSQYVEAARSGQSFQAQARDMRKDGSSFAVEAHGAPFVYRGEPAVLGVVRDISARAEAYELLGRRVAERTYELEALLAVTRQLNARLELPALLSSLLDELRAIVDYTGAGILALEGDEFVVLGYRGPLSQEQALALRFPLASAPVHARATRERRPILIADTLSDDPIAVESARAALARGVAFPYIRSWILAPLIYQDRVIGALSVEHARPNRYTERDLTLAFAIANQAAVAIENARLYARAQEAATLEERQRLARELHDSVSQAVYSLSLYAEGARRLLVAGRTDEAADYLTEIRRTAREALAEMRLLIYELRPPILAEAGLVAALRARIESVEGRADGLSVTFHAPETYAPQTPAVEDALYRIAQEALNNALRYAKASAITVILQQDERATRLEVRDNGAGFDVNQVSAGRLGIAGMRERAARIGATLDIESAPEQGTALWIEIPR